LRKIITCFLLISILFLLAGCDFNNTPVLLRNTMSEGDFIYNINTDGSNTAIILGFTEEGLQKECLIVPESIGGYLVRDFNCRLAFYALTKMENENVKKIFFPYEINIAMFSFDNMKNIKKIIVLQKTVNVNKGPVFYPHVDGTYSSSYANVTFISNNEIYWIDDYDYGNLITMQPPTPSREGYIFAGWYKDPEYLNEWNFFVDKLPEEIIDDKHKTITYQETKLYAKWEIVLE